MKSFSSDFNTNLFLCALDERGVKIDKVGNSAAYTATYQNHNELIYDIHGSLLGFNQAWIMTDKYYTKKLLTKYHIKTALGEVFNLQQLKKLTSWADKVGYPVVVKPTNQSHGDFVFPGIDNQAELIEKFTYVVNEADVRGYALVEKHVSGQEYRILYINKKYKAVVRRDPAFIVGDGKNTINKLIEQENYRRMNPRNTCLCTIKLDLVALQYLDKHNMLLSQVPKKGEKIQLRESSNVSMGGWCTNVTDETHASAFELAKKISLAFGGIPFVGFDLICEDISQPLSKQSYAVAEVNPSPGLSLHVLPATGESLPVHQWLAELLFPETVK